MAKVRRLFQSFGAGEMSPEMFARVEDARFQSGVAKMQNMVAQPQGSARNRSGFEFVREVADSTKETRVIPFRFSTDQTTVVELSEGKFRFHTMGATLFYVQPKTTPIANITTGPGGQITFTENHNFSGDEKVRVISLNDDEQIQVSDTGGAIADPDEYDFYVKLADKDTIILKEGTGGSPEINITGLVGITDVSVILESQVPKTYAEPDVCVFNASLEQFTLQNNEWDDVLTDDPIQFDVSTGSQQVEILEESGITEQTLPYKRTFYAIRVSETVFQFAREPGGAAVNVTNGGDGDTKVWRVYKGGEQVYRPASTGPSVAANFYVCVKDDPEDNLITDTTYWTTLPVTGILEIPNPYVESELFDVHYTQSGDVMTLVHPNHPVAELRRVSATEWGYSAVAFNTRVKPPSNVQAAVGDVGERWEVDDVTWAGGGTAEFTFFERAPFSDFDIVYVRGTNNFSGTLEVGSGGPAFTDGFYSVLKLNENPTKVALVSTDDHRAYVRRPGSETYGGNELYFQYIPLSEPIDNRYQVTSFGDQGEESEASGIQTVLQNGLDTDGAFNTVTWSASANTVRYRVYKEQVGLFGIIGETDELTFDDKNIAPDLSVTPPIKDTLLNTNFPGAVGYYEQRRVFGGPSDFPQTLWLTRTGTESDLGYSLPIKDDDRIQFGIASREASTVRHIVPLDDLLILTNSAEYRVTPINDDALTPASIAVRPQSYVGASNVQPWIVNTTVVFCANRGGHVREMGYNFQRQGYLTGDLSLRSAHLFDNLTVKDMGYGKAPDPVLWFVSSNGKLLGLTYAPEERIGAWHQHTTSGGTFESVAAVSEGDEDVVYAVVKRGSQRNIERMSEVDFDTMSEAFFVDSGIRVTGTQSTTIVVSGGTAWNTAELLTVTLTPSAFLWDSTFIGDEIVLTSTNGSKYRLTIESVTSEIVAEARPTATLPADLQDGGTKSWSIARKVVPGLTHLEGETVAIVADGVVQAQQVVASGQVTLTAAAEEVIVGLPITAELQTAPLSLQVEAAGQGRMLNVNEVWVRVFQSSSGMIGPDSTQLVPIPDLTKTTREDKEVRVQLPGEWTEDGQVVVRQTDPLPLTVVGLTLEVSIGG